MGKKILLADDSITIQKVIELTFSDEDFDVVTVGNGRLALERLPEVRPDIVLCDIIMPEKDGYEVCEQIKANPAWSQIPVLLLTGAFEPFDQERAARVGYDGSLAKPFEPETLIAKVKELLARSPRPATATPPSQPPRAAGLSATLAPSVVPFGRPSVAEAVPPAPDFSAGFVHDEPFASFEEEAFASSAAAPAVAVPPVAEPPSEGFASLSDEESATLAPPPEHAGQDSASTVMFRAGDLPWASAPAPAPAPAGAAVPALPPAATAEPGPMLVPESSEEEPEIVEEQAVFEAVLEEDLDFGPNGYVPEPHADDSAALSSSFGGEIAALPPLPSLEGESPTGQFAALVGEDLRPVAETSAFGLGSLPRGETVFEPEPATFTAAEPMPSEVLEPSLAPETPETEESLLEPALEPEAETLAPEAVLDAPTLAPESAPLVAVSDGGADVVAIAAADVAEPIESLHEAMETIGEPLETAPEEAEPDQTPAMPHPAFEEFEPAPDVPETTLAMGAAPELWPAAVAAPSTSVAEPQAAAQIPAPVTSFADVLPPSEEPPALPPSEAAAMAVPVDMVEKIAQRVVAQISEKAVREIAWDIIPDLAEALVKQEIERLKAELAKL